jgi:hypothetical protein
MMATRYKNPRSIRSEEGKKTAWGAVFPTNAHLTHQSTNTSRQRHACSVTTAALVPLPLHVPRHLAGPIPRGLQELLVDDLHEAKVFSAFTPGSVIQRRARQLQQCALPPLAVNGGLKTGHVAAQK